MKLIIFLVVYFLMSSCNNNDKNDKNEQLEQMVFTILQEGVLYDCKNISNPIESDAKIIQNASEEIIQDEPQQNTFTIMIEGEEYYCAKKSFDSSENPDTPAIKEIEGPVTIEIGGKKYQCKKLVLVDSYLVSDDLKCYNPPFNNCYMVGQAFTYACGMYEGSQHCCQFPTTCIPCDWEKHEYNERLNNTIVSQSEPCFSIIKSINEGLPFWKCIL